MNTEIEFIITAPLDVEETVSGRALLKGVFLKLNSETKNGRIYEIEEGEQIATDLQNMPAYFGADWLGKHILDKDHMVGRIIEAIFDKASGVIRGIIEIWNNSKFPNLISKVGPGWGLSIKGKAAGRELIGGKAPNGLPRMKIKGMQAKSISIISPQTRRGQKEAQVEEAFPVEETVMFDPCPWGECEIEEVEVITNITTEDSSTTEDNVIVPEVEESEKKRIIRNTYIIRR